MLKTKTYCNGEEPAISVIRGRLTKTQFKKAFKNEWRDQSDGEMMEYGFGVFTKKGFRLSDINNLKAELVTFERW